MADPNNRWESVTTLGLQNVTSYSWLPEKDRNRAQAYEKYDQLYWNDKDQYRLRVLEDEKPVFVPNPRTIVDTTSHYFLKGLRITVPKDGDLNPGELEGEGNQSLEGALKEFLDREMFYARFHVAKHAGVARGDFVLHLTADPEKEQGKRLSLTSVFPGKVLVKTDPDDVHKVTQVQLVQPAPHPDPSKDEQVVQVLTYRQGPEEPSNDGVVDRTIYRSEVLYSMNKPWYDPEQREEVQVVLAEEALDSRITAIPVYLFRNLEWDGDVFGSSELRGFESDCVAISQTTTDQGAALSLEGLGVYATDGGKPVDGTGADVDWEIAPAKVMEVPSGAYFRRVEGVGSVKPSMDHIEYLESKLREAGGLSDVALGRVDVATAQSGIALAIKFMPTLAKIEERDIAALGKLTQLFYDWKTWMAVYESKTFEGEILPTIGDKLPTNRTERVNELNNMMDRKVISREYYRIEMTKMGYIFPKDIEAQIDAETEKEIAQRTPPELVQNATDAAAGDKPIPVNNGQRPEPRPNRSNNAKRPNESGGTESSRNIAKQARGGKPPTQRTRDA